MLRSRATGLSDSGPARRFAESLGAGSRLGHLTCDHGAKVGTPRPRLAEDIDIEPTPTLIARIGVDRP